MGKEWKKLGIIKTSADKAGRGMERRCLVGLMAGEVFLNQNVLFAFRLCISCLKTKQNKNMRCSGELQIPSLRKVSSLHVHMPC